MPDTLGYRAKMGVLMPSTNTAVEAEYNLMRPPGVTFHAGRIHVENPSAASNDEFEALIAQLRDALELALRDVVTCRPDYLVMGLSSETFWEGVDGNRRFVERVRAIADVGVSTGASAIEAACRLVGAERIALLSPYQPVADEKVAAFLEEIGLRVVRVAGLRCPNATAIAEVPESTLRRELAALDGPDVDAIVQVGTNLPMVRVADEAERWLGKPVFAVNAATVWHALRANGIDDRLHGFGTLLREH